MLREICVLGDLSFWIRQDFDKIQIWDWKNNLNHIPTLPRADATSFFPMELYDILVQWIHVSVQTYFYRGGHVLYDIWYLCIFLYVCNVPKLSATDSKYAFPQLRWNTVPLCVPALSPGWFSVTTIVVISVSTAHIIPEKTAHHISAIQFLLTSKIYTNVFHSIPSVMVWLGGNPGIPKPGENLCENPSYPAGG